jgi:hypothetical protein
MMLVIDMPCLNDICHSSLIHPEVLKPEKSG